ncbi:hypothetical protein EMCRGX_G020975 [Ephydatia muelleri]
MDTYSRNHIRIMKVALAIAIVRQKPNGMRVREYVENLALQFTQLQGNWRHKALKLEQELLCLRQELVQCQLRPQLRSAESQEIHGFLPWTQLEDRDKPQSVLWGSEDGALPTGDISMDTSTCVGRERIRTHVRFLSSVSTLMHANHYLSLVGVADLRAAVQDTVIDATKALGQVLESGDPGISSYQSLEAVVTTVRDTIRSPLMRPFESDLMKCCEELQSSLVKHLRRHHGENGVFSVQLALCILCTFPPLFAKTLDELADQVGTCSEALRNTVRDAVSMDSGSVGALGAILSALETLLSKYSCSQLPQETRSKLLKKLESSLLGLAVAFPLFSYTVWRLTVYLQPQAE